MLALAAVILGQSSLAKAPPILLQDAFGRDLSEVGVTLIDWEGRIANPAIRLRIVPGPKLYLPARVRISANGNRLEFNLWSEVGPEGPTKTIFLDQRGKASPFLMSTFPDSDGDSESYELNLEVTDANEATTSVRVPVRVIDQDQPMRPIEFPIVLDFSRDQSGFFSEAAHRQIAEGAASDWAYFLDRANYDPVPAGTEKLFQYDLSGFAGGHTVDNKDGYSGFLMLVQGIAGPEKRSGAIASDQGGVQTVNGKKTGLRRSGTVAIETTGNYNGKGWLFLNSDQEWWRAGNMSTMVNDFASIIHHEMGHSLVNHRVHPAYESHIKGDTFVDQTVRRYLGGDDPKLLEVEHFYDTIDPVSRVGAFGNEYGGDMPRKRWLITKFDLLVMQACGYRLRDTSPFARLNFEAPATPVRAVVGEPFSLELGPLGGIPTYEFRVFEGRLPSGLTLDSWTGHISGVPKNIGDTSLSIQLRDNDPTRVPVVKPVKISVLTVAQAHGRAH